jgi:hypothetical protein
MENYKILDGWQNITVSEAQYGEQSYDEEGNELPLVELVPRMEWKTVTTEVEFYLDKGTIIIEVPHFMPKNDLDIIRGLDNRFLTENNK